MHLSSASLLSALLSALAATVPVHAQNNDMFSTKAAAQQRAKQLHCTGVFLMGEQWMPCKDINAYDKALKLSR